MPSRPARRALAPLGPSDRPLYDQVRQRLIEGVSAGEWGAGEAIPTEAELSAAFGVAIGTIRKAVDSLVAEHALVRHQGKGTYVTAHDGGRLLYHFFHIVPREGPRIYPESRTVSFRRDRADAPAARALGIAPNDKVIRIRNVLRSKAPRYWSTTSRSPRSSFQVFRKSSSYRGRTRSTTCTRAATGSTCSGPTSG
jgi:GntR family transcriptional regulator